MLHQFTAARLKGDVREKHRLSGNGQRLEEAAAGETLRVGVVRLAETEEAAVRFDGVVVGVDLLRHAERRPRVRPAGVERDVREDLGHLAAGHAVRARGGEMIFEGRIGYPLADECGYGHDGAQLELITRTFLDILSSVCIGNLVSVDSGAVPML